MCKGFKCYRMSETKAELKMNIWQIIWIINNETSIAVWKLNWRMEIEVEKQLPGSIHKSLM